MGWLTYLIFGALAGMISFRLMGSEGKGCFMNIVLGVVGAVVGGMLFKFFGGAGVTGFNIYSFAVAIVGAMVVIGIARIFSRKR